MYPVKLIDNTSLPFSHFDECDSTSTYSTSCDTVSFSTPISVSIFDWDDTLFPTKALYDNEISFEDIFTFQSSLKEIDASLNQKISLLEQSIINLFTELTMKKIEIFIVSNADKKWINNCLNHFMNELKEFIEENEIKIYSAKNLFKSSTTSANWKKKCFKRVLIENFSMKSTSIDLIAIGDSLEEKKATFGLKKVKYYDNAINSKIVQMVQSQNVETLIKEISTIQNNIDDLFKEDKTEKCIYVNDMINVFNIDKCI